MNDLQARHESMAALCDNLRETVYRMLAIYEDGRLDDTQPESFAKVIPMSLDDWHSELCGAADDWRASAANIAKLARDAKDSARDLCERYGFREELGGGGAITMERFAPSGARVALSCDDGGGMPAEGDFMGCYYPAGYEGGGVVFTIRHHEGATLEQAAAALGAMLEAGK